MTDTKLNMSSFYNSFILLNDYLDGFLESLTLMSEKNEFLFASLHKKQASCFIRIFSKKIVEIKARRVNVFGCFFSYWSVYLIPQVIPRPLPNERETKWLWLQSRCLSAA